MSVQREARRVLVWPRSSRISVRSVLTCSTLERRRTDRTAATRRRSTRLFSACRQAPSKLAVGQFRDVALFIEPNFNASL